MGTENLLTKIKNFFKSKRLIKPDAGRIGFYVVEEIDPEIYDEYIKLSGQEYIQQALESKFEGQREVKYVSASVQEAEVAVYALAYKRYAKEGSHYKLWADLHPEYSTENEPCSVSFLTWLSLNKDIMQELNKSYLIKKLVYTPRSFAIIFRRYLHLKPIGFDLETIPEIQYYNYREQQLKDVEIIKQQKETNNYSVDPGSIHLSKKEIDLLNEFWDKMNALEKEQLSDPDASSTEGKITLSEYEKIRKEIDEAKEEGSAQAQANSKTNSKPKVKTKAKSKTKKEDHD